jgi:hypothetical protein
MPEFHPARAERSDRPISDLFQVPSRFLRSVHLERDFDDPSALDGYIVTPSTVAGLQRLISGLRPRSGQRAWRVTGDYGSGKSSFGLVLAHLLSADRAVLPSNLRDAVDFEALGVEEPLLVPVLVTGAREGVPAALLRGLRRATDLLQRRSRRPPAAVQRLAQRLQSLAASEPADDVVLEAATDLCEYVVASGRGTGLLVILDELGKFLEYAALHPDREDVYLLQRLAEVAARSGDRPLLVVGLLHQGFHFYAEQLPTTARQEWEKVAGRFEELIFSPPLEHTAALIAGALNVDSVRLPSGTAAYARRAMEQALALGWYGAGANSLQLLAEAPRLYPVHATVLPCLTRMLARFGQNERSLFGFLLSSEPSALQDFATQPACVGSFYRLHDLYDHVRATFGYRLAGQSYRNSWLRISELIDGAGEEDDLALRVLKTVGLLNLLDAEHMIASREAIVLGVSDEDQDAGAQVEAAIEDLRARRLLYDRGLAGGYCLWPHTSVDLEKAFEAAGRAVGSAVNVSGVVAARLDARSIVARRHYLATGTLRHFEVRYAAAGQVDAELARSSSADGVILVPLCDTPSEREEVLRFAASPSLRHRKEVLIAVPRPLVSLAGAVQDAMRWEWVAENTPELNHDAHAAAEVARQVEAARGALVRQLTYFVGLHTPGGGGGLVWYHRGESVHVQNGRGLLAYLSDVCDDVYDSGILLPNELINRRTLSAAAAGARTRLIERLLESPGEPRLGLDSEKAPPEKSIYLSLLHAGNVHRQIDGSWVIAEPEPELDPCRLRPSFERLIAALEERPYLKLTPVQLWDELRRPPYGVRDGVLPILLAVFAKAHEHELAFYENGSFLPRIGGPEFLRLVKSPETFHLQLSRVPGVRAELFERLLSVLGFEGPNCRRAQLLDVVTTLCVFAAQLPEYVRKTKSVSVRARAVRSALLQAKEPVTLLLNDLPIACGIEPFGSESLSDEEHARTFVHSLRDVIDELRGAYSALRARIADGLADAFDVQGPVAEVRRRVSARSADIVVAIREPRMKAFSRRLCDDALAEEEWLESLASFVRSKPPARWMDTDESAYVDEIRELVRTFERVESVTTQQLGERRVGEPAVRVIVTGSDGNEADAVVFVTEQEDRETHTLEETLSRLLPASRRLRLAAVTRLLSRILAEGKE